MRISKKTNKRTRTRKTNKRKTNKRKTNKRTRKLRKNYKGKKIGGGNEELILGRRRRDETSLEQGLDEAEIRRLNKEKNAIKNAEKIQALEEEKSEDMFIQLHNSLSRERRSTRGESNNTFIPKDVVPGKAGYNAVMNPVSFERIREFVETQIEEKPQLVTLPVSGMSHIILVDVQPDKIMISDWRGRKFIDGEDPNYENYKQLMSELERKYRRSVNFYFIDPVFLGKAEEKSNSMGKKGGCSEYAYAWSGLYYKKGYYEWPFSEHAYPPGYPFINLLYIKSNRYKGL
jgi:hypothetical protein